MNQNPPVTYWARIANGCMAVFVFAQLALIALNLWILLRP